VDGAAVARWLAYERCWFTNATSRCCTIVSRCSWPRLARRRRIAAAGPLTQEVALSADRR
jgi:hypothetical protein